MCAKTSSEAHLVLELCDFLVTFHDGLLHDRLLALQLHYLFLHVIVLSLLLHNASLKLLKVSHDVRVDHFDVLIVLGREVILHEADLLSQHLNLFLVLAEARLANLDPVLDSLAVAANVLLWRDGDLSPILPERTTLACCARTVTMHRAVVCLQHFNNLLNFLFLLFS